MSTLVNILQTRNDVTENLQTFVGLYTWDDRDIISSTIVNADMLHVYLLQLCYVF